MGIHKHATSFWQSPLWCEILEKTGYAEVIELPICDTIVYIERRSIWNECTGLFILGVDGKLVSNELLQKIVHEVRKTHDLFLQIEALAETRIQGTKYKVQNTHGKIVSLIFYILYFIFGNRAPFRRFLEPTTAILNLAGAAEEPLLTSFTEKGRYNIRLAQKRGITTRWVGASDEKSFDTFYNLLTTTTKRDKFSGNSRAYYKNFLEVLEKHHAGGLLVAEKDGVMHAGGIFVYHDDQAIYYYGASSDDQLIRRDMATYLVQWVAIQEAIKRECTTYDFLGISKDGKGKLRGVSEFKRKFNPEIVELPREVVIKFHPIILFLMQGVSFLRKKFR